MAEEGEVMGKRQGKAPLRYAVSGPCLQLHQHVVSPWLPAIFEDTVADRTRDWLINSEY